MSEHASKDSVPAVQALLRGAEAVDTAGAVAADANAAERVDADQFDVTTATKVAELLKANGISPDQIGRIDKVRVGSYEMITKDDEGEAHKHKLEVASLVLTPTAAAQSGPAWPVVQPAAPVTIRYDALPPPPESRWKTAVVFPDPQIGYRLYPEGGRAVFDPFHDERAIRVALEVARLVNPNLVINLGDLLDLPEFSSGKFAIEPSYALTTQEGLNRAHRYLAEQKAAAPHAEIIYLEGNHELRLSARLMDNAKAAFGLKRANAVPEEWPVMSVPYLLRLDELGVRYIDGYPAGAFWINENLRAIHGYKAPKRGTIAKTLLADDPRISTITGHIHRFEDGMVTLATHDGPKVARATSLGCLCRIDGAVPSTRGAIDSFGRPVTPNWEQWQQMCAVITFEEGNGKFSIEPILIHEGFALFRGQPIYVPPIDGTVTHEPSGE